MPNIPDEDVVAIFGDGTKFSMGDFRRVYSVLPPAQQQMALHDREAFLHQWELWRRVTKIAELSKLDQESPYKQQIEYARMNALLPAQINAVMNQVPIEPDEIVKFYDANKRKYSQVKVKAIFIAFSDAASSTGDNGMKALTEAEAKARQPDYWPPSRVGRTSSSWRRRTPKTRHRALKTAISRPCTTATTSPTASAPRCSR